MTLHNISVPSITEVGLRIYSNPCNPDTYIILIHKVRIHQAQTVRLYIHLFHSHSTTNTISSLKPSPSKNLYGSISPVTVLVISRLICTLVSSL